MAWSAESQAEKERLLAALIRQWEEEVGGTRAVGAGTDPCRQLGICEENLDEV